MHYGFFAAICLLLTQQMLVVTGNSCVNKANSVVLRDGPFGCRFGIFCRNIVRPCTWVGQDPKRCNLKTRYQNRVNYARDICVNQCKDGCRGITVPTLSPVQGAPTVQAPMPAPMQAPMQAPMPAPMPAPMQAPTLSTTQSPIGPIGNLPPGPYVTVSTSSEVVTIPRPPTANVAFILATCPHSQENLRRWHDISTWAGGNVPKDGADITIPDGFRILVDQTVTEKLGVIKIPSNAALIFGSNPNGISFQARGFDVLGELIAGSETCLIKTPITITLHGKRKETLDHTYKGIVVSGGKLSLHGERFYHTWTRLAKTVNIDDTMILLQEPINWKAGQQIVVVTSAMKDSRDYNHNEVFTIQDVVADASQHGLGSVVYLTTKAKHTHLANNNYQVEVGLLTRSITIQGGADDSEPEPWDTDLGNRTCMDTWFNRTYSIYRNTTQPCMDKHLTGFGGHIRIESNGIGQVEGVELYRMGQTNVMGRYPMHFHLLGSCPTCYFKYSSVHRSFYRCVSIHGTDSTLTTENVAYDVIGFCYYLEDGIEQMNTISFNLAAHIHMIGPSIPRTDGHRMEAYVESKDLTLPADVAASGFYITNVNNTIVGNAASGGWAGFAFPVLPRALQTFTLATNYSPAMASGHLIDGNTAHSTGWWWGFGSGFYLGGELYYDDKGAIFQGGSSTLNQTGTLTYLPGRGVSLNRNPCLALPTNCKNNVYCNSCSNVNRRWLRITNSKTFLIAGTGVNSWSGRLELVGYEAHDTRLSLNVLSNDGFWLSKGLVVCRTGENLGLSRPGVLDANGIVWYDTGQSHIVTDTTFRNCGARSSNFSQNDGLGGCDGNSVNGCDSDSSVFSSLSASNEFLPEIMQATKGIKYENCGRILRLTSNRDSASSRTQSWMDVDGSTSQQGVPTMIVSGLDSVKDWWGVDAEVVLEPQGPHRLINVSSGPRRNIGYIDLRYDEALQNNKRYCSGDDPCPVQGYIRHAGRMFANTSGMPIVPRAEITGPTGGYGWIITFLTKTVPRSMTFGAPVVDPNSRLLISIPYPIGTTFEVIAYAVQGCQKYQSNFRCNETFTQGSSIDDVRFGQGNTYHVDNDGVLTFRLATTAMASVGIPFKLPDYNSTTLRPEDLWAMQRFERDGVLLPQRHLQNSYAINVKCPGDTTWVGNGYCPQKVGNTNILNWSYNPDVCPKEFIQYAYDRCCHINDKNKCVYADGSKNF